MAFIKGLEEDEIEKIKNFDELSIEIQKAYSGQHGQDSKSLRFIRKEFLAHAQGRKSHSRTDQKNAQMILNRIDVFSNAVETLVYFRNTAYHRNDPIDDPGHATALAGTVLHMIEHSVSSGNDKAEARIDALRKKALSVLKLCGSFYGEDEEQATSSPTPLESPSTHTEEEKEEANIVVEKLEEFRSEWEDAVKTLLHRIPDESQMRLLASNAATQSAKKILEALNKEEFSEFSDEEESNRFDTDEFEEGEVVSPSLTPIQAENRLIVLRDHIKNETKVQYYHNVLQRKFVKQMIKEEMRDMKQWEQLKKSDGPIKEWYEDSRNDPEIMDEQLERYGEKIFAIISSIAAVTDDIPS